MAFTIRRATSADLGAVARVYNAVAVTATPGVALPELTLAERANWFSKLARHDHPVLVLVEGGEVVGYANYAPFRDQPSCAATVEHSVYVLAEHRYSGGGRMLMNALIDHARGHGVKTMLGVMAAADADSLEFHFRLGFEVVGRLPNAARKFDRWLDLMIVAITFGEGS